MNPMKKHYAVENYKEILKAIEEFGRVDYLRELENRIIQEIVSLIHDGSDEARKKLARLEKLIEEDLDFVPRNRLLVSALKNSIMGAISAAKLCL